MEIPELSFKESVFPISTSAMGGAIDPPRYDGKGPSGPVRVSDKGVMPASDTDDTTYLSCHTSTKYGADAYPCDRLTRKVSDGDHLILTTDAGTLTYTVTHERSIPYDDFATDHESWDYVPNRVVLVMCDILDGTATGANYVVYATLNK